MKNPKERTALFEEISGSGALSEEYEKNKVNYLTLLFALDLSYVGWMGVVTIMSPGGNDLS